ncbi:hypothetical protein EDC01DRAFT_438458 [Geopyxis carbonaria]|nr:hypothetical protein EDC01DRAFT_438458 [Geopyxis carbonaria]
MLGRHGRPPGIRGKSLQFSAHSTQQQRSSIHHPLEKRKKNSANCRAWAADIRIHRCHSTDAFVVMRVSSTSGSQFMPQKLVEDGRMGNVGGKCEWRTSRQRQDNSFVLLAGTRHQAPTTITTGTTLYELRVWPGAFGYLACEPIGNVSAYPLSLPLPRSPKMQLHHTVSTSSATKKLAEVACSLKPPPAPPQRNRDFFSRKFSIKSSPPSCRPQSRRGFVAAAAVLPGILLRNETVLAPSNFVASVGVLVDVGLAAA